MSQLISLGDLINQSWTQYKRDWKECLNISVWLLAPILLMFAFLLLTDKLKLNLPVGFGLILLDVAIAIVINLYVVIRLMRFLLTKEKSNGAQVSDSHISLKLFFSFLWVLILRALATLGATVLFIFPGIWLSIRVAFYDLFLLDDDLHGTQALAASYATVKGRWWRTFAALLVPAILFGAIFGVVQFFLTLPLEFTFVLAEGTSRTLLSVMQMILGGLVQALFIPLMLIVKIRFFKSLKDSKA